MRPEQPMARKYRHPLCRDMTVVPTRPGEWEDLIDRSHAPRTGGGPVSVPESRRRRREDAEKKEQRISSYMTHELRAPLTSVRSALGLLKESLAGRLTPQELQTLELALRNSERLNGLIDDIMDYSKVRSGKMPVRLEEVTPFEVMQEAVESLRSWAVKKGVRLVRLEADEPLPRIQADRRRTVQVLTNLVSNAIKFTPAGGKVEISASLGRHEHTGTVRFKVNDTGPGIDAKDLERIFGCFEQSASGTKVSNGTGLGLTLAKAMVEAQGGRIWAESWKGLGATFLFTLPVSHADLVRPVTPYEKAPEYSGLLVGLTKRLNSFVAAMLG